MAWQLDDRRRRRFDISKEDQRSRFARDRDRILYSSAFHRLAGITQIVRAGEVDVFHTRQQHTIKVAQIGRRLAENCLHLYPDLTEFHGVDAEVVEAACLAHDLGHPPFGHIAEETLNELVEGRGDENGYEGNAQSFRILTKLSVRYDEYPGLDLTRAVLAACLKYPWLRDISSAKKREKWSAYNSEEVDFSWAREFATLDQKTAEAEIMDWADDIAYSVHDLEDFHRVGVIPWHTILAEENETTLTKRVVAKWFDHPADAEARARTAIRQLREIFSLFPGVIREAYDGSRHQRWQLRNLTSLLIGRYIRALKPAGKDVGHTGEIGESELVEVKVLKQIARDYVINLPALGAQQRGQCKVVTDLFNIIYDESSDTPAKFLPMRLRYLWLDNDGAKARFAADCVASLTENEAVRLHQRLTGVEAGSVLDPIVR